MTRNQLPEGVGKKIVEALKRQAEADITPVSADALNNDIPLTNIEDLSDLDFDQPKEESAENFIVEEEPLVTPSEDLYKNKEEETPAVEQPVYNTVNEVQQSSFMSQPQPATQMPEGLKTTIVTPNGQINIPPNVSVLKNLISTLPVGVTKQTGAQIIRQTLEAMGLPMNTVLKEAQEVQEQLTSSTRECMLKIQEYKTNILQLEQSVQEYQRNVTQINDLVSLFLLTDRK